MVYLWHHVLLFFRKLTMPTYFDVISFSDVEIDETTQLYLVQAEDKRFALRACSTPMLADLKSDPLSRSVYYWPIDKAWLPNSTEPEAFSKIFSCDVSEELGLKLTTELLTRENVKDYLRVNPLDDVMSDHAMGSHDSLEVIDNVTQLKSRPFDQNNPQLIAERRLARIRLIANTFSAAPNCFSNQVLLASHAIVHRMQLIDLGEVLERLITTARDKPSERDSIRLEVVKLGMAVRRLQIQIENIWHEMVALNEDINAIATIQMDKEKSSTERLNRLSLNAKTLPSELDDAEVVRSQSSTLLKKTALISKHSIQRLILVADISTQSFGLLQAVATAFSELSVPIKESAPTRASALPGVESPAPTPVARVSAQVGQASTGSVRFFNSFWHRFSGSGALERSSDRDDAKPSSSQP